MTVEEEKAFLARHLKAAEAGEFVTIDALFQAYKKELGRSYTRDAFYQLLKRHGWRNVKKYEEFGLDSLLQETRGGRNHAYMTVEEEKAFLARHLKAAEAGEFVTIDALFQAYKKELGRSYTRDAFYQLLKRHGWRNITPRPEHPKKADAQTIVASKNKISIQEDKKAL
ncbi:transposase [Streptococcus pneumoniae]|nr:transposase [Streptococcus pneumoniae]